MAATNVLIGQAGHLPYDIQTQQSQVQQRRKMAEAMLAASMQSGTGTVNAGGGNVQADWATPIGNIAKAYFGGKERDSAAADESKLAGEYNQRLSKGVEDYLDTRDGGMKSRPEMSMMGMTGGLDQEDVPRAMEKVPGNPRKAIVDALATGLDPLKTMAAGDISAMNKNTMGTKDYLGLSGYSPKSKVEAATSGDPTRLQAENQVKDVNGQVVRVNPDAGPASQAGDFRDQFGPVTTLPNGIPVQTDTSTGRTRGISGGNLTPVGQSASNEFGKGSADLVMKSYGEAQKNVQALQNMANIRTTLAQTPPEALGTFSNVRNTVNKVLEGLGGKSIPETANVQELNSLLGHNMLDAVRALAPVTEEDVKIVDRITGSSTNSKQALEGVMDFLTQKMARGINSHNALVDRVSKMPGSEAAQNFKIDFNVNGNAAAGAGGYAPMSSGSAPSLDDLLNKYAPNGQP